MLNSYHVGGDTWTSAVDVWGCPPVMTAGNHTEPMNTPQQFVDFLLFLQMQKDQVK